MIGDITKDTPVSSYQPPKEIADLSKNVKRAFSDGVEIITKEYVELNNMSVIERDNRDQRTFNAFVDESIEDPNEAWKWRGTRSKARNKAIAMHAQLTAGYVVPMFMAQNDMDEEDRDFSEAMRDVVEWMVNNSDYKSSFLNVSMGMLVNSVTYLGAEYAQIYQTIRERTEKGYTKKEIIDEVLSGFKAPVYSSSEILITNAHEQNIQRQRSIIKRRYIDYAEAKAKYGEHDNWQYTQPGTKSVYSDNEGVFYDVKDDDHPYLIEEATYLNRSEDTEVCFLGGIYMGEESVENNPIRHRDNRNAPKYNVTPFGYQRINEHFFFYKSLMNAQYWDNALLDAQYEVGMNRLFLDANMPLAITGTDQIDTEIVMPNAVAAFANENVKVSPILPAANLSNLFQGMAAVEQSMDESSVSDVSAGQMPDAAQKATGLAIAERNAKTLIQGVGKTLAESIVQYGGLMADIAIQHLTIPILDELSSESGKIRYRSFILNDKVVKGKNVSKIVKFDESLLGKKMSKYDKEIAEVKMAEESGYPDSKQALYRINPELFARMKYLVRVEPERMFPENEEFMKAMMLEIQAQFQNNPYVSLEALTRKTLYQFFRGDTEEFMAKKSVGVDPMAETGGGTIVGNQAKEKALSGGLAGVGIA